MGQFQETGRVGFSNIRASVFSLEVSLQQLKNSLAVLLGKTPEKQQDLYASAKGAVATNLIQVYKAIGGGWEIRDGQDPVNFLPGAMKKEIIDRTPAWEGVL